jgi:leucyl aminopeptidase (aminopeptidase T)
MRRGHIGHVLTAEVLAAANLERLENDLSVCVRSANECAELCRAIARKHEARGEQTSARCWRVAADEAASRARQLAAIAEKIWIDPEVRLMASADEKGRSRASGASPHS